MRLHPVMRTTLLVALLFCGPLHGAEYVKGTWHEHRAFSPAVITQGGRIVWLAGESGIFLSDTDEEGNPLDLDKVQIVTDFDTQAHNTFRRLEATLKRVGGSLQDMVTMTVYLKDVRHGDRFVEIRKEYFPKNAPASALITVSGFAIPEMLLEVQGIAVIDER